MKDLEKLITEIMTEAEADGEPVTREEAEEMAKMELNAKKVNRYTSSDTTKKPKTKKVRKVDEDKKVILERIAETIATMTESDVTTKTETECSFEYNGNSYTIKLTKHRPPKK